MFAERARTLLARYRARWPRDPDLALLLSDSVPLSGCPAAALVRGRDGVGREEGGVACGPQWRTHRPAPYNKVVGSKAQVRSADVHVAAYIHTYSRYIHPSGEHEWPSREGSFGSEVVVC
ncbi:hypothetical protein CDD83_3529 [Cordyceps sp. RAO-2017]|nr:hypothetical protein CDD83_3529 [Cordyceps sp. RAO-2017]